MRDVGSRTVVPRVKLQLLEFQASRRWRPSRGGGGGDRSCVIWAGCIVSVPRDTSSLVWSGREGRLLESRWVMLLTLGIDWRNNTRVGSVRRRCCVRAAWSIVNDCVWNLVARVGVPSLGWVGGVGVIVPERRRRSNRAPWVAVRPTGGGWAFINRTERSL